MGRETGRVASVIIPTYNRKRMLLDTLDSLAQQTLPSSQFEVLIVDDGGTDGTNEILKRDFPFRLLYFWKPNQGDALARNFGAEECNGDILVSLDDDMILEEDYLRTIIEPLEVEDRLLVAGSWYLWTRDSNPLTAGERFQQIADERPSNQDLLFTEINTHSLAIRRDDFFRLGMMQDLGFPGSSMWTDVDLAYRAFLEGYRFLRVANAVIWHRDYVHRNLTNHKTRMYVTAYRSVRLFNKYPQLIDYLPMFDDKRPVQLRTDPFMMVIRKTVRKLTSRREILWILEKFFKILGEPANESPVQNALQRWIIGGYIYRGYRSGLSELH
jgi:GT2 family glycosyltransferase